MNTYLIIEITVETKNVRVTKMRLNLNLAPQLMLNLRLLKLVLKKNLQRNHVLALHK